VPAGEVDGLVARAGADLLAMRTVSAGKLLSGKAAADFYLVQAGKQSAAEARFIRGDDRLRPFTKAVQDLTPAGIFPEIVPPKIVRRVTLTCPGQGSDCTIDLVPASAAVFAGLNAIPPNIQFGSASDLTGQSIYRVGGRVAAPVITYKLDPPYSKQASKNKIQGTVTLSLVVDVTGHPRNIKVVQGLGYGLDENAIDAVSHWEFRPGTKDGQPVATAATIQVNFRLLKDQ
jgi:TonB family protein